MSLIAEEPHLFIGVAAHAFSQLINSNSSGRDLIMNYVNGRSDSLRPMHYVEFHGIVYCGRITVVKNVHF